MARRTVAKIHFKLCHRSDDQECVQSNYQGDISAYE